VHGDFDFHRFRGKLRSRLKFLCFAYSSIYLIYVLSVTDNILSKIQVYGGCCIQKYEYQLQRIAHCVESNRINLLKTKRNLFYIRNQTVPRSKLFLPQL
jgi:hypothetical protein